MWLLLLVLLLIDAPMALLATFSVLLAAASRGSYRCPKCGKEIIAGQMRNSQCSACGSRVSGAPASSPCKPISRQARPGEKRACG